MVEKNKENHLELLTKLQYKLLESEMKAEITNMKAEKTNMEIQQKINDLHRSDISAKVFCYMIKNSTPASNAIKKIIGKYLKDKNFKNEREIKSLVEENIISILFAKFKKRKLIYFIIYNVILLILLKIIPLNSLIDFLVVIIKKYLP